MDFRHKGIIPGLPRVGEFLGQCFHAPLGPERGKPIGQLLVGCPTFCHRRNLKQDVDVV